MPAYEGESEIFARLEAEQLLSKAREGVIELAYTRLDEAITREEAAAKNQESAVYFWHDEEGEDTLVLMLTRDGVYPFSDEIDQKEQILIKFSSDDPTKVNFEYVKDGERNEFELRVDELRVVLEDEEPSYDEAVQEPTEEDVAGLEHSAMPMSEMSRLSLLREKIRRFQLTQIV